MLDLSRVLAEAVVRAAARADLGATVAEIERPGTGDDTARLLGPPYLCDADGHETTEAAYYLACNGGKLSIAIDFTRRRGGDATSCARLPLKARRPRQGASQMGGLAKYGLDYASVAAINPRLVYCSIAQASASMGGTPSAPATTSSSRGWPAS